MSKQAGCIMFAGGEPGSHPLLAAMRQARQACARDTLTRIRQSAAFAPLIVVTDDPDWTTALSDLDVIVDPDPADRSFHFGQRLAEVIARYQLDQVLYVGAASMPLLREDQLAAIGRTLMDEDQIIVTNNIHSSDWAAFKPAAIVADWTQRLANDNGLGWVLSHDAGLKALAWPSSPATRLDVDVPVDAQLAALHPDCGLSLRETIRQSGWDDQRLRAVREIMGTAASRVILAGRVPSWAWAQMERLTQCWVRVYSEERGMRAAGRLQSGEVRSLLNDYLQVVGLPQFVTELSGLADAVLIDTRVLWAARKVWPSAVDRYASDLGRVDWIEDPFVREFTQAIVEAPIPIVTGGHALVSGGLWTLLESMPRG
jgi:CTP:molybdopterin cytidylyltransferase MocA